MTVDREKIREYATSILDDRPRFRYPESWNADKSEAKTLARHCLALLAELEQAEKERGSGTWEKVRDQQAHLRKLQRKYETVKGDLRVRESRLAKVPALVEALRRIREGAQSNPPLHVRAVADKALEAWEQAT